MEEITQENTTNITAKSESLKAMKNRCIHCKQTEGFMCDSVHFNDGDHTVEELLEFRKSGFSIINDKKCQCFKDFNLQSNNHFGSFFFFDISFTMSSDKPFGALSASKLKSKPHL